MPDTQIGNWNTREEARKFWDHIVCDECVYCAEPFDVDIEGSHVFAEKYVRNDLWFHIRWTQLETGHAGNHHNEAVIEAVLFDESGNALRKLDSPIAAVDRNGPVFVEVPEFIELPKMMSVYGIRSIARLKGVQGTVDTRIEHGSLLPVGIIGATDRKGDSGGGFFVSRDSASKQMNQVPSELIERSAETINEVSNGKRDFFVGRSRTDYENVLRSIRIVLFGDRIRVAFDPISKLLLSRLEVKVSPSGFHVDILN